MPTKVPINQFTRPNRTRLLRILSTDQDGANVSSTPSKFKPNVALDVTSSEINETPSEVSLMRRPLWSSGSEVVVHLPDLESPLYQNSLDETKLCHPNRVIEKKTRRKQVTMVEDGMEKSVAKFNQTKKKEKKKTVEGVPFIPMDPLMVSESSKSIFEVTRQKYRNRNPSESSDDQSESAEYSVFDSEMDTMNQNRDKKSKKLTLLPVILPMLEQRSVRKDFYSVVRKNKRQPWISMPSAEAFNLENLLCNSDELQQLLLQFPPILPMCDESSKLIQNPFRIKSSVYKPSTLTDLPEGKIGKLIFRKSGKVELCLGNGMRFDVSEGSQIGARLESAALIYNEQSKKVEEILFLGKSNDR